MTRRLPLVLLGLALAGCETRLNVMPLGLPALPVPADNPLTADKAELGRKLFMDRRLSHNGTISCAMCHVPEQGFTSNEVATAIGIEGRSHRRNSPTVLNAAFMTRLFHDGRETTLENQVWGPLLATNEMANPSVGYVVERIRGLPDYAGLFEKAFAGRGPTMETIGQAIASYERTLVSADSRFDRWYYGRQANALTAEEQSGFGLFAGKAGCGECHTVTVKSALFTDSGFHNTGIGWARSMANQGRTRVQLAPGVYTDLDASATEVFGERPPNDVGRFEVTQEPADRWAYKTPTLRDVALTAPYMHDGSIATLEEVVEFYDRGGIDNPLRDPRVKPLNLSADEKRTLVAFLRSLTGADAGGLAAHARRAVVDGAARAAAR